LDLGKHVLENMDNLDEDLKEKYYELLYNIVNRGEFDLSSIGFDYIFRDIQNQSKISKKE
jgi:hypothetical protein